MHSFELGGDKKTKGAALTFVCLLRVLSHPGTLTSALKVNAQFVLHWNCAMPSASCFTTTNMHEPCYGNMLAFAQKNPPVRQILSVPYHDSSLL